MTTTERAAAMRRDILRGLLCAGADIVTMLVAYFAMRSISFGGWWPEIVLTALIALAFAVLFAGRRLAATAIAFVALFCLNVLVTGWSGITFYL